MYYMHEHVTSTVTIQSTIATIARHVAGRSFESVDKTVLFGFVVLRIF